MTREPDISATTADGQAGFETKLSAAAIEYARQARHISRKTLERLGAGSGTTFFPRRLERKSGAVFFPYHFGGAVVNWKACAFPEKDFIGRKGGTLCFFNLDAVLSASPGDVWITEGEWDAAALIESGVDADRVLSVPNGARERHREEGDEADAKDKADGGYRFAVEALKAGLAKHKRFIWCGDMDSAGLALRQDMARILGAARFWFVEWPDGCKDANDMLRTDGPGAVHALVTEGTLPWPVDGLYSLRELPEMAPLQPWSVPCLPAWGGRVRMAPGTMSVVTGHPGHGKTALMTQIWHDIAEANDLVVAVATFETRAKPHFRRMLRSLHMLKLEREMTAEEITKADQWIESHYRFLVHPTQQPTLSWLLDRAEVAVVRHGAKVLQVDPWNRLESQRQQGENETDYIGRCLTALYVFAQDFGVHVQVLAHPAKMDGPRKGRAPELDDIAGCYSADTDVLTDRGWVPHSGVSVEDRVACFDPERNELTYQRPTHVHHYRHTGEMRRFKYKAGDLLVTPNHRMVVKRGWPAPSGDGHAKYSDGWNFIDADSLGGGKWIVPKAAPLRDGGEDWVSGSLDAGYDSAAFWAFIGWWIAEGSESMGGLSICQAEDGSAPIKALIETMRLQVSERVCPPTGKGKKPFWVARVYKRQHPQFCDWVLANCGIGCENKRVPPAAWGLPLALKRAMFDGMMDGDGSVTRNADGRCYTTTSPRLADDVQRLAIELGHSAQVRPLGRAEPHHKDRYQVNIGGRDKATASLHPYRNMTVEQYDGEVFCLTVPTGAYVTRRNGWASICGNSKHWDNRVDQGFVVHRPRMFEGTERCTEAVVYHKKARFEELGYPSKLTLDYDITRGRFVDAEPKAAASAETKEPVPF